MTGHQTTNGLTRRVLLQRTAAAGAVLAPLGSLAGCFGDDEGSSSATAGQTGTDAQIAQLTWALPFAAQALDPVTAFDDATVHILANVLGGLLVFDDQLRLQPNLAERWEQPDDLTYRYTLREGLKFSDGSPLTAEDVVFSMKRSAAPDSNVVTFYGKVKSIKAVGARDIEIKLSEPDALFKNVPAHPAGWIVSKAATQKAGKGLGSADAPLVGAGPFRLTKFTPGEAVEMERNPDYWGEAPRVQKLSIKFIEENSTRLLSVRSGSVDGTFQVPLEEARSWERLDSAELLSTPGNYFGAFSMNTTAAPFDDIHARRAVAYATNSDGIVNGLLGGHAQVAIGGCIAMPILWGGYDIDPDEIVGRYKEELTQYPFDLDKAKEELAQSKTPDGFDLQLDVPDAYPRMSKAALALKQDLGQIGIKLTVSEIPFNKWIATVFGHEIPPFLTVVGIADFPDPMNLLYLSFHSEFAKPNAFNLSNYANKRADRLMEENLTSTDTAQRAESALAVATQVSADMPQNAVRWEDSVAAVNTRYVLEGYNGFYFLQPWGAKIKAAA